MREGEEVDYQGKTYKFKRYASDQGHAYIKRSGHEEKKVRVSSLTPTAGYRNTQMERTNYPSGTQFTKVHERGRSSASRSSKHANRGDNSNPRNTPGVYFMHGSDSKAVENSMGYAPDYNNPRVSKYQSQRAMSGYSAPAYDGASTSEREVAFPPDSIGRGDLRRLETHKVKLDRYNMPTGVGSPSGSTPQSSRSTSRGTSSRGSNSSSDGTENNNRHRRRSHRR